MTQGIQREQANFSKLKAGIIAKLAIIKFSEADYNVVAIDSVAKAYKDVLEVWEKALAGRHTAKEAAEFLMGEVFSNGLKEQLEIDLGDKALASQNCNLIKPKVDAEIRKFINEIEAGKPI